MLFLCFQPDYLYLGFGGWFIEILRSHCSCQRSAEKFYRIDSCSKDIHRYIKFDLLMGREKIEKSITCWLSQSFVHKVKWQWNLNFIFYDGNRKTNLVNILSTKLCLRNLIFQCFKKKPKTFSRINTVYFGISFLHFSAFPHFIMNDNPSKKLEWLYGAAVFHV